MSEHANYFDPLEVGNELAELCRAHEIGPEWIERAGSLDDLVANILDDCDRRLGEFPQPAADAHIDTDPSAGRTSELRRVRTLVAFARDAATLRDRAKSNPSLVAGIEGLERIRNGAPAGRPVDSAAETSRALELFDSVGRLCHKINNPLTSLMGRAQMLQLQPDAPPEKVVKSLQVVEESARRVATLVQELGQLVCSGKEELLSK